MGLRPRTPRARRLKQRRCPNCGKKLSPKLKRCRACHRIA